LKGKNMSDENIELLCTGCGEAFSTFLQGMADHNAKVTACPKCGKNHEFKPPKTAKLGSRARAIPKPTVVARPN
jgi:rRNA maturation endonuclease Nob1